MDALARFYRRLSCVTCRGEGGRSVFACRERQNRRIGRKQEMKENKRKRERGRNGDTEKTEMDANETYVYVHNRARTYFSGRLLVSLRTCFPGNPRSRLFVYATPDGRVAGEDDSVAMSCRSFDEDTPRAHVDRPRNSV